jgi:hypothetical protein
VELDVNPFALLPVSRDLTPKMGGEALSLMMSTHSNVGLGGTGTSFAVLRRRASPPPVPKAASQSL